nr:ABC transporter B family member 19 [Ipomoea batatas]
MKEANLSLSTLTYNELLTLYMSVGQLEEISSCAAAFNIDEVRQILDEISLDSGSDECWTRYANLSFSNLGAFSKDKAAGYKLMEILKQKLTIVQNPTDGKSLAEVQGNIELKNVTFSYPSRPDVIIFINFSIFFPVGKTIAVVGGSGFGKSIVVSLIERFYDPNEGEILLDNVDIRTL